MLNCTRRVTRAAGVTRGDSVHGASTSSGYITLPGQRLEYFRIGETKQGLPTLVFLHEGLGSVSLWRDFPAKVAALTGCGALVYSRPGYGRSNPKPPPWETSFMSVEAWKVLPHVLNAAEIQSALLVGHSDGASIALLFAARDEEKRTSALVLLAPHVFVEDVTLSRITQLAQRPLRDRLLQRLWRHHGTNADSLLAAWTDVWLSDRFREWNITSFLPSIHVPVLVVQGENDEFGTTAQVNAIVDYASGPVEIALIPRCGHAPQWDAPDKTLALVTHFIAKFTEQR